MKSIRKVGRSAMLLSNKCTVEPSIKVKLTFDDDTIKERVLSIGDLISVEYNGNGLKQHVDGTIICISANGTDPKGWYIIVDGSDDFASNRVRFAPTSILDVEIIRKGDTVYTVKTPIGIEGIKYLRNVNGYLEYSDDGITWKEFKNCRRRCDCDEIEPQEGTVPMHGHANGNNFCDCDTSVATSNDDVIEGANY